MRQLNKLQSLLIAVVVFMTTYYGNLLHIIVILGCLMVIDYLTGLAAAPSRGETWNSTKGEQGVYKKVLKITCVFFVAALDAILMNIFNHVFTFPISGTVMYPLGTIVGALTICNEIISILENFKDSGVKVPTFITRIFKNIRSKAEKQGNSIADKTEEGESK